MNDSETAIRMPTAVTLFDEPISPSDIGSRSLGRQT